MAVMYAPQYGKGGSRGELRLPPPRASTDPSDLVDGITRRIAKAAAREILEQFGGWPGVWILTTLIDHPMSSCHLVRYIRLQAPRLLPEAVEHALHDLANSGLIECQDGRWRGKLAAAPAARAA